MTRHLKVFLLLHKSSKKLPDYESYVYLIMALLLLLSSSWTVMVSLDVGPDSYCFVLGTAGKTFYWLMLTSMVTAEM